MSTWYPLIISVVAALAIIFGLWGLTKLGRTKSHAKELFEEHKPTDATPDPAKPADPKKDEKGGKDTPSTLLVKAATLLVKVIILITITGVAIAIFVWFWGLTHPDEEAAHQRRHDAIREAREQEIHKRAHLGTIEPEMPLVDRPKYNVPNLSHLGGRDNKPLAKTIRVYRFPKEVMIELSDPKTKEFDMFAHEGGVEFRFRYTDENGKVGTDIHDQGKAPVQGDKSDVGSGDICWVSTLNVDSTTVSYTERDKR